MRIIGIDPGLRFTGYGVIDVQGNHLRYVASGTIRVPTDIALAQRLNTIFSALQELISTHQPTHSAIEKVFVNVNPHTTLLLGQARGAALCALAFQDLPVFEYTALQIKKTVVGQGHAAKEQIQTMVRYLLALNGDPAPDAADALACAICHAHHHPLSKALKQQAHMESRPHNIRKGRFRE